MLLQLGYCPPTLAYVQTQEQTEEDKASTQSSPASNGNGNIPKQKAESQAGKDFIIGPGDVLNVFVWKEPEVSRSVPVRPDGKISLPLVNDVQAVGFTAVQLKGVITDKLKDFIADPNVTVTVEKVNSQKVTIMGEVTSPGPQSLTGPTKIMDILATSRFTPFAKTTRIYVLRDENGKQQRLDFNYKDYIKGKNPNQNILLKNGDTIIVP
jgi:polysaccharide biosynthesis/export protein